jgi:hypothetical protein
MKLRKKSFSRHQTLDLSTFKGRTTILQYLISTTLSLSLCCPLLFSNTIPGLGYMVYTHIYIYIVIIMPYTISKGFFFLFNGGVCFVFVLIS